MQEAEGYRQRVIASAEGDASRFKQVLVEYEKAPSVTRERMYIDMMQQILVSTSKVMVDQKNGSSLLYLPLDKLIQSTAQGAAPLPETPTAGTHPEPQAIAPPTPAPTSTNETATAASRARDALRGGRSREARP